LTRDRLTVNTCFDIWPNLFDIYAGKLKERREPKKNFPRSLSAKNQESKITSTIPVLFGSFAGMGV